MECLPDPTHPGSSLHTAHCTQHPDPKRRHWDGSPLFNCAHAARCVHVVDVHFGPVTIVSIAWEYTTQIQSGWSWANGIGMKATVKSHKEL